MKYNPSLNKKIDGQISRIQVDDLVGVTPSGLIINAGDPRSEPYFLCHLSIHFPHGWTKVIEVVVCEKHYRPVVGWDYGVSGLRRPNVAIVGDKYPNPKRLWLRTLNRWQHPRPRNQPRHRRSHRRHG